MRLAECRLEKVYLAPRMRNTGELGGVAEQFSDETLELRASCLPEGGEMQAQERGAVFKSRLRLLVSLVPADASPVCGDGIWVCGVLHRILRVEKWTAHLELVCEAI